MTSHSFRARPARVQAMPFTTLTKYEVLTWIRTNGGTATEGSALDAGPVLILRTEEGSTRVCLGDWIILSKDGTFSRCSPHEFVTRHETGEGALLTVLAEVEAERDRQDMRWGEQNHRDGTGPEEQVLPGWTAVELADAARNSCHMHAQMGIVTWRDIFGEEVCEALAESDPAKLRAELVQAVAVGVAWIQAIDRRTRSQIEDPATVVAEQLPALEPVSGSEVTS